MLFALQRATLSGKKTSKTCQIGPKSSPGLKPASAGASGPVTTKAARAQSVQSSGREGPMRRVFALGAVIVGGVIAARRFLPAEGRGPDRQPGATMGQRMLTRMIEGLPPDSPPKLVMSILPRLREQNDEIIALLREQNELLRRGRPEPVTRGSEGPG